MIDPQSKLRLKQFLNGPANLRASLLRFVVTEIPVTILLVAVGAYVLTEYVHPFISIPLAGAVVACWIRLMWWKK